MLQPQPQSRRSYNCNHYHRCSRSRSRSLKRTQPQPQPTTMTISTTTTTTTSREPQPRQLHATYSMAAFCRLAGVVALVAAITVGLVIYLRDDAPRDCRAGDEADPLTDPQCFFSTNYHAARALFLHHAVAAAKHGVTVESLPLGPAHPGLFVDVAVRSGRSDAIVLHVSGTHGTEGYLGSAVQTAFLRRLRLEPPGAPTEGRPTVVLVHALNAYGMAHFRRWNEDNIDLNRNCLATEAEWNRARQRDPNIAGYENITTLLNPQEAPGAAAIARLVTRALWLQMTDFRATKRALVAGTYVRLDPHNASFVVVPTPLFPRSTGKMKSSLPRLQAEPNSLL